MRTRHNRRCDLQRCDSHGELSSDADCAPHEWVMGYRSIPVQQYKQVWSAGTKGIDHECERGWFCGRLDPQKEAALSLEG